MKNFRYCTIKKKKKKLEPVSIFNIFFRVFLVKFEDLNEIVNFNNYFSTIKNNWSLFKNNCIPIYDLKKKNLDFYKIIER